MRPPLVNRDPGDEQPEPLFDPASTLPPKCSSCQTTRKNLCKWAADRHHYGIDAKQPRTCLLRYDPKEGVIPY